LTTTLEIKLVKSSLAIDYVKINDKIDNQTCQEMLGVDRGRTYRLLTELVREGKLVREGDGGSSREMRISYLTEILIGNLK